MVTKEELLNLAILSKLEISEDNIEKLLSDMEEVIKFADKVNLVSEEDVKFDNINDLQNVYREDVIVESSLQSDILKNAKTKEYGFFRLSNHE